MNADPVRERRARIAGHASNAKRLGYLFFLVAIVIYAVGLATTFTDTVAVAIVVCLVAGSVVLAPAIIFGYAVKAAERDDREHGR